MTEVDLLWIEEISQEYCSELDLDKLREQA